MLASTGHQQPHIEYPGLSKAAMMEAVDRFYLEYFLRPHALWRVLKKTVFDTRERRRLTHEAREFLRLRTDRKKFIERERVGAAS